MPQNVLRPNERRNDRASLVLGHPVSRLTPPSLLPQPPMGKGNRTLRLPQAPGARLRYSQVFGKLFRKSMACGRTHLLLDFVRSSMRDADYNSDAGPLVHPLWAVDNHLF
ncbi:hypothetical protein LzC2_34230 [Planctomycetes bacterium LzC2]|uniref:Uncharacterized protein n=1 Tax=Alienimonas chondri TaxID=2681879 RepID=A0ABX1VIQ4_9PLAN|nr:hypothetical protein [Alienimonas chondri]